MKKYDHTFAVIIIAMILVGAIGCQDSQTKTQTPPVEEPTKVTTSAAEQGSPPEKVEPAQDKPTEADPAGSGGKIVMIKAEHDFGKIGPGSSHNADFEFKNDGAGTLLVNRLQSTCGCSKPTLIKDGKRHSGVKAFDPPVAFEPGEKGQIEVTFKAPTTKGKVKKSLYVHSNDPESPREQFSVMAEVVVKVSLTPEKVELNLEQENAGMPDIAVKSLDGQEFSITSIFSAQKAITVPFDPDIKQTEFVLKPAVDIEKLGTMKTGIVQIKTSHPQAGMLMVRYNVKPMFELSNPRFILQNVEPGVEIVRENLIRSNYGKPVEIASASSRNGYMSLESQEAEGDHMRISVKITPPEKSETSKRYITDELTIVLKDGQELPIRCSGWFRLKK